MQITLEASSSRPFARRPAAPRLALLGAGACLAVGCADAAAGSGQLRVSASGEQAAVKGFPVGSGADEIAFVDGWTLEFDKVLVSLSDFALEAADGDDAGLDAEAVVVDLHEGDAELWAFEDVPARRWDRVGFRYAPPSEKTRVANAVDADDLALMADAGYSLYVEATAEKDGETVRLAWGFPFAIRHSRCVGEDSTDGLVVEDNARNEAQITVHLDHLFFDSYASEEAALRFDPIAAVAPSDGPVRLEHLAQQDNLSDLRGEDGSPLELGYDPGSSFSPRPDNLQEYVIAAATTTGHWNGEGHCDYERE